MEQKKITINGMENIFDVLNRGYEHLEYITNIHKEEKQEYNQTFGNTMTITTFTINTQVGFDDILITLYKNTYMQNCCHINIKNRNISYVPNIGINYALYELLLGLLDNFYMQFCLTKKDKIKILEEDFDTLNDTMILNILNQLTATEIANLSKNHNINERIFEVSKDTINWNWVNISTNPNLSVEFIRRNYNYLYLNIVVGYNNEFVHFLQNGE